MKKIMMLALLSLVFYANTMAKGIPIVYCSDCEYITVVGDLPDSAQFYSEEYKGYMDIGYKYNQFWILWLPLWNSKGEYCLTIKGQDVYFEYTKEEIEELAKSYNIKLPSNPIPFWDKIGGKALLILLLAVAVWYFKFHDKPKQEESLAETAAETTPEKKE
jgi:hypothetical protein